MRGEPRLIGRRRRNRVGLPLFVAPAGRRLPHDEAGRPAADTVRSGAGPGLRGRLSDACAVGSIGGRPPPTVIASASTEMIARSWPPSRIAATAPRVAERRSRDRVPRGAGRFPLDHPAAAGPRPRRPRRAAPATRRGERCRRSPPSAAPGLRSPASSTCPAGSVVDDQPADVVGRAPSAVTAPAEPIQVAIASSPAKAIEVMLVSGLRPAGSASWVQRFP